MEYRPLGQTSLQVSALGFGCGNVGALMVRGDHADQVRAVNIACDAGINYFDTAAQYGNGESERNLGRALKETGREVFVGTKVRVHSEDIDLVGRELMASVEGSLRRLGRDRVDLVQLHNSIGRDRTDANLSPDDVISIVVPAFTRLQQAGKIRFYGFTGLGETEAVNEVVDSGALYTVQVCYNLLNPSAGRAAPEGFPYQDYGLLLDHAAERGMGTLGIRVLAAGALTGSPERHPIAAGSVAPIGTGADYDADLQAAERFQFLVGEGIAGDMAEAAVRFALSTNQLSTVLVGLSSVEQLEHALAAVERGPLPADALGRLSQT